MDICIKYEQKPSHIFLSNIAETRDNKVKSWCSDLENGDTDTKIIQGLGIPKVDLDIKYDLNMLFYS